MPHSTNNSNNKVVNCNKADSPIGRCVHRLVHKKLPDQTARDRRNNLFVNSAIVTSQSRTICRFTSARTPTNVHSHATFAARRFVVKIICAITNTFTQRTNHSSATIAAKDSVSREHWPCTRPRTKKKTRTSVQFAVEHSINARISRHTCKHTPNRNQMSST